MSDTAYLSYDEKYTIFKFENANIRFLSPYSLEYFAEVKQWENGYLVVMAKYRHNDIPEEEYIDLIPVLEDLYIEPESFIKQIQKVDIDY
ncbi:MAG: hypothetical protein ACI4WM_01300 [Erysipelotrichaceae bacterium]